MNDRILHNLSVARRLLLTVAAALAIAVPVTFGLLHPTPGRAQNETATPATPIYASVSIKPSATSNQDNRTKMMFSLMDGGFVARGVTLERLIQLAYHVQDAQIWGSDDFLNKTKFDIDAKLFPAYVKRMSENKGGEVQGMLKSILTDQFKLAVHSETRNLPAYDLVVDENGTKLKPSGNEARTLHLGRGVLGSSGVPLDLLAAQLSARLGRPVVDKTGLKGNYAFKLHWTPNRSEAWNLEQAGEMVDPESADANGPSLVTALEDQLGLKLRPHTEPVEVLVIDHAEQPADWI